MTKLYRRRPRATRSPQVPDFFREHSNPECNLALWLYLCGEEGAAACINRFTQFVCDEAEMWSLYRTALQAEWNRAHPGQPGPPIKLRLRRRARQR